MALPPIPPRGRNIRSVPAPSDAPSQLATLSTPPVIEHNAKSAKDDGIDSTLIQPSEWNDVHKMTLPAGSVIGRDPSGAGPAQSFPMDSEPSDAFHIPTTDYVAKAVQDGINATLAQFVGSVAVTGDVTTSMLSAKPGWLLLDGTTVGNVGSGANFADATAHDLFVAFWSGIGGGTWPFSPARGASAEADWAANKTFNLPDARGRALVMLDGGVDVNTLVTAIGQPAGEQDHVLNQGEMPAHQHGGTLPPGAFAGFGGGGYASGGNLGTANPAFVTGVTGGDGQAPPSGLGFKHNNVQPSLGINMFVKL